MKRSAASVSFAGSAARKSATLRLPAQTPSETARFTALLAFVANFALQIAATLIVAGSSRPSDIGVGLTATLALQLALGSVVTAVVSA
jgi:hypothetical protein